MCERESTGKFWIICCFQTQFSLKWWGNNGSMSELVWLSHWHCFILQLTSKFTKVRDVVCIHKSLSHLGFKQVNWYISDIQPNMIISRFNVKYVNQSTSSKIPTSPTCRYFLYPYPGQNSLKVHYVRKLV